MNDCDIYIYCSLQFSHQNQCCSLHKNYSDLSIIISCNDPASVDSEDSRKAWWERTKMQKLNREKCIKEIDCKSVWQCCLFLFPFRENKDLGLLKEMSLLQLVSSHLTFKRKKLEVEKKKRVDVLHENVLRELLMLCFRECWE